MVNEEPYLASVSKLLTLEAILIGQRGGGAAGAPRLRPLTSTS